MVGRTGSGKSTLLLTLLRLIPVTGGTIMLDGVDTASLGVDALRRQVAVIPQDPVLFSGGLGRATCGLGRAMASCCCVVRISCQARGLSTADCVSVHPLQPPGVGPCIAF